MRFELLMAGKIVFGNPEWLWPVVGTGLVMALVLFVTYATTSLSTPLKLLLTALKISGLVLLGLCLLNPQWSENLLRPGENIIVMLVDNSASMQIRDARNTPRSDAVAKLLSDDHKPWQTRLHQDFDLRRYLYGEQMRQVEDFAELDFSDTRSQLAAGLTSIEQRFRNQPLAGVLLLSDGNVSDLDELQEQTPGVPIFPIVSRDWQGNAFDVAIDRLSVSETPFEDAPVTVTVTVSSTSDEPQKVIAKLERDDRTQLAIEEIPPDDATTTPEVGSESKASAKSVEETATIPPGSPVTIRLQIKPTHLGVGFYRLRVLPADEQRAFDEDGISSEVTLANNERLLAIDRGSDQKRILYVGGRPSWEFKFFNRALREDYGVHLVGLIRIARKEAKFDFRGRVGEESNSLFRGFKDEASEETESFDQAVLKPFNVRDASELSDGFPKTKVELYEYEAVILDDVEANFLSHDQQILLDRYVSERGGGLLMLGGRDSFRHGEWQKSSLRDAFPVYLDRAADRVDGELLWDLTRDGWLEPWMRTRSTEDEEQERLSKVPPVKIVNPLAETKPGARVFAEVDDGAGHRLPAVVAHQYGQGRSVAVLVGDLWRWSLSRANPDDDDLAQMWRQLVRWVIADVPQRVETEVESIPLGFTPAMQFHVRVRSREYRDAENASVNVSIETPTGEIVELDAEPDLAELGKFTTTYVPREPGAYIATVTAINEDDGVPVTTKVGWTSEPDKDEFQSVDVNTELLAELAERSGGEVIFFDQLEQFVKGLPQREMPVTQVRTTPLWHTPWIILLALACLAAEWGLRRQRGLP